MLLQIGTLLPLIVAFGLLLLALRALFRTWLRHQLRLALLAGLERKPPAPDQERAVADILKDLAPAARLPRQDYRVTGLALAAFGLISLWVGRGMATGTLAVGLYEGGVVSAVLGILIAAPALVGAAWHSWRGRA